MAGDGRAVISLASWCFLLLLFAGRRAQGLQKWDAIPGAVKVSVSGRDSSWRASDHTVTQCTSPVGNFALKGVDVVAYFSLEEGDEAVWGSTDFVATFGGYRYLFASAENKALFEARLDKL